MTMVKQITTTGSVTSTNSVSAFLSMYEEMYKGKAINSCQKTIQYPVKISRKIMNRGFDSTTRKFFATFARLGAATPSAERGSLNSASTRKNINKTLSAAMRNTFSTLRCLCTHEASSGPKKL